MQGVVFFVVSEMIPIFIMTFFVNKTIGKTIMIEGYPLTAIYHDVDEET